MAPILLFLYRAHHTATNPYKHWLEWKSETSNEVHVHFCKLGLFASIHIGAGKIYYRRITCAILGMMIIVTFQVRISGLKSRYRGDRTLVGTSLAQLCPPYVRAFFRLFFVQKQASLSVK